MFALSQEDGWLGKKGRHRSSEPEIYSNQNKVMYEKLLLVMFASL